jgi:3-oxoacyl-[acyl-carrier protein] reductase
MKSNPTPQAGPPAPGGPYSLAGRRAVVTGSSSGIGRAIALELASAGASVLVHANRSLEEAERVRHAILARGVESAVVLADLKDRPSLGRLVTDAWRFLGRVDVWVNNAGADTLTGGRHALPYEEKLDELLRVDVAATVLLSREAGRRMAAEGGGVILNMGWDQAASGMEGESGELFAAAKGAVMSFTKSLALSLAPAVRVNCLAPGWIRTAWGAAASARWQKRAVEETPLGRWGTPEDVAHMAHFLVSDAASFITGQVVAVNGGAVRR